MQKLTTELSPREFWNRLESEPYQDILEVRLEVVQRGGNRQRTEASLDTLEEMLGFVGKGVQCIVKTELALNHKRAQEEVADNLHKTVAVVTDNDGDISALKDKYAPYMKASKKSYIGIFFDSVVDTGDLQIGKNPYNYNTLEPKMLKENSLTLFNELFGTNYSSEDELRKYMKHNKTECALAIFDTKADVKFPQYITEAIAYVG